MEESDDKAFCTKSCTSAAGNVCAVAADSQRVECELLALIEVMTVRVC